MKVLVLALLVSLVAVVNCQTPQQQQCKMDFLINPDNSNVAVRIATDCAGLSESEIMRQMCTDMSGACFTANQPVYTACSINIDEVCAITGPIASASTSANGSIRLYAAPVFLVLATLLSILS